MVFVPFADFAFPVVCIRSGVVASCTENTNFDVKCNNNVNDDRPTFVCLCVWTSDIDKYSRVSHP